MWAIGLVLIANHCLSQIVVNTATTVIPLVEQAFDIKGIKISNVQFQGQPVQFGYFENGTKAIGIENGLVLTSGVARGIAIKDVDTQINSGISDDDLLQLGRKLLADVAPQNVSKLNKTTDAAVVTFELIPALDNLKIQFVFASEEYPDFGSEAFADIMGIFIAGKGYSGEYSAPADFTKGSQLISLFPDNITPVSQATVGPTVNTQYFVENRNNENPDNPFNGCTRVVTINIPVISCEKYFLKFAVADGDGGSNSNTKD